MLKNITAVIPVRQGSRRLKNKNIAPFGDSNLLLHKISQLKTVKEIQNIVVTSDSDLMLSMAKTAGVRTHKRALEYCDEMTKTFGEVVRHVCENVEGEHILWATCTSPLVSPALYTQAINEYEKALAAGFDSLASFQMIKRYLWDEKGPINYELGLKHVPSQSLPPLYIVTDGILMAPRQKMIEWSYFHGTNPYRFIIDKRCSVDVDDGLDLACAKAWLNLDESTAAIDPFQVTNIAVTNTEAKATQAKQITA